MSRERDTTSQLKPDLQRRRRGSSAKLTAAQLDATVLDHPSSPLSSPLSSCPPTSSSPNVPRKNFTPNARHHKAPDDDSDIEKSGDATAQEQDEAQTSFLTSSFPGSSQRVVKNGDVVVTNSDSDTDSDTSVESPEALLARFTAPHKDESPPDASQTMHENPSSRRAPVSIEPTKYSFSIDDLLVHSVDDGEMQTNVTKARQSLEHPRSVDGRPSSRDRNRQGKAAVRDGVLESVVEDSTDAGTIQRLRDAVDRTEVFDGAKSWSFFEDTTRPASPLRFPQRSIPPGFWGGVLCQPEPRERAFFSGIVRESWSVDDGLPDELIIWILHAVTVEPRDDLRYAYCSSLKVVPPRRLEGLIDASRINQMFRRIGAKASALSVGETLQPGYSGPGSNDNRDYRYLLSVLDLLTGISRKLNHPTREHLLKLVFRLTLDEISMGDSSVCVATQDAIITLLQDSDDPLEDLSLYEICLGIFKTVQDVTLQSHLLKHLLPITPRASLFRSRLALAFLYQSSSPLDTPPQHLLNLKRITALLDDQRFDVSRKSERSGRLDYWSFSSLISILSAAIDCSTLSMAPPGATAEQPSSSLSSASAAAGQKAAENKFNSDVDDLAERIKAIFTSIQDSGASHLKRTEAKESLQALHYRLIYGVRTRERPRKLWFVSQRGVEDWGGLEKSKETMDRFLVNGNKAVGVGVQQEEQAEEPSTTSSPKEE